MILKANELMIGDWVLCDGKSYQIAEIGGMVCIDYENELFASLEDIEPIPLTPEILEKNEFSRKGHDHYHLEFGDYGALASYPRFGGYAGIFFQYKDTILRSEIRYVHELQHALRLCGIEKEIII